MKKICISKVLIYLFISGLSILFFLPMLLTVIVSITDEDAIIQNGYSFIPAKLSLYAYQLIFNKNSLVLTAYTVSITVTIVGTALAVIITGLAAYTLANKHVKYRNGLALYFFITTVFTAGLVPWYLTCRNLGLTNNIWALIVPTFLFSPFNLFLVRNFMNGIPDSLMESATIDGAGDLYIAVKIYFPLSKPVLATISLFCGLAYWNDWFNAIMLVDDTHLYPLQFMLMQLKSQINMINQLRITAGSGTSNITAPTESIKMATAIVTVGPIILLYPFLQRYFVKGLIIGAIKG